MKWRKKDEKKIFKSLADFSILDIFKNVQNRFSQNRIRKKTRFLHFSTFQFVSITFFIDFLKRI